MRILPAKSPNFSANVIDPVFVVLHYTACDRERALAQLHARAADALRTPEAGG